MTTRALVLVAALLAARGAQADAAGDALLSAVDAAAAAAQTQQLDYDVVSQERGKPEHKLALRLSIKGDKRLYEFLAPADMKGTKLLFVARGEAYVYLPAFGKVRRIASTAAERSFMGLAFTLVDLQGFPWAPSYSAALESSSEGEATVLATARQGGGLTPGGWSKIELNVARDHAVPTQIKYRDADGAIARTETRSGYTCEGRVCAPGEIKLVDERTGSSTRLIRTNWKVNEALSDDVFSKRALDR